MFVLSHLFYNNSLTVVLSKLSPEVLSKSKFLIEEGQVVSLNSYISPCIYILCLIF